MPSSYAKLDRAALETRLVEAEARVDKLLPMPERFKIHDPAPENEDQIRPFLDKVFGTKVGEPPKYEIECRGMICHLTSQLNPVEWQEALQMDPAGMGKFQGMSFGQDGVYMQLEEPGRAAGNQLMIAIATTLQDAAAVRECKKNNPIPSGTLVVKVSFDSATRRLRVETEGQLALQTIGVCVRRAVEDLVVAIPISAEVTTMEELPIKVEVP